VRRLCLAGALTAASSASADAVIIHSGDTFSRIIPAGEGRFMGVGRLTTPGGGTCTATAIGATTILTAAHCLQRGTSIVTDPHAYRFTLNDSPFPSAFDVSGVFAHPSYVPIAGPSPVAAFAHDIAILSLASALPPTIPIYSLFGIVSPAGTPVTLVGFGRSGTGATGSSTGAGRMRTGANEIDGYSYGDSIFQLDFDATGKFGIGESMIAPGDSGGPLLYNLAQDLALHPPPPGTLIKPVADRYQVLGVASHSSGNTFGSYFGYISVTPYLDWIRDVAGPVGFGMAAAPFGSRDPSVVPVAAYLAFPPEPVPLPNSAATLLLGCAALLFHRRRRTLTRSVRLR
jgi:hypothetical protein